MFLPEDKGGIVIDSSQILKEKNLLLELVNGMTFSACISKVKETALQLEIL